MMVAIIGYDHYALHDDDARRLLGIARRATRVHRPGSYNTPYVPESDQRLLITTMVMDDVDLFPLPEKAEPVVPAPRSPLMTPADPDDDVQF